MNTPKILLSLSLFLLPLAPACGGGGGGGGDGVAAPTVQVTFPTSGAVTTGASITVIGGTTAGPTAIAAVRVEGVDVQTNDGFETWSVRVPLSAGPNSIEVEIEDADGNLTQIAGATRVERQMVILQGPVGVDVDDLRGSVYVVDRQRLCRIGLGDGITTLISGSGVGSGIVFTTPIALACIDGTDDVYIVDAGYDILFHVDAATGESEFLFLGGDSLDDPRDIEFDRRTGLLHVATSQGIVTVDPVGDSARLVSDKDDPGQGPRMLSPLGVALDAVTGLLYVLDESDALFVVDPATGARAIVSAGKAAGLPFQNPTGVAFAQKSGLLYVTDTGYDLIVEVDPTTGARTFVATEPDSLPAVARIAVDPKGRLLVTDFARDAVLQVEPASGELRTLATSALGRGPGLYDTVTLDMAGESLLTLHYNPPSLVAVDLSTGDRTLVSGDGLGAGDDFQELHDLVVVDGGQFAIVSDYGSKTLVEVDLRSGDRQTLAVNDGTGFSNPDRIELIPGDRVLVGNVNKIHIVDLATGTQSLLTQNGDGKGPDMGFIQDIVWDPVGERALVSGGTSFPGIVTVDIDTGNRLVLTDGDFLAAGDVSMSVAKELAIDSEGGRVFVHDYIEDRIVSVDLESGARTTAAGSSRGVGPSVKFIRGLTFDAKGGQLLTYDSLEFLALGIEPSSGDRVIVSK